MSLKFTFDDNFQKALLNIIMNDSRFALKSFNILKPQYFKNEYYSWFFMQFKSMYEQYEKVNELAIDNELLKFEDDKKEIYDKIWQDIINPKSYIKDHIINKLTSFAKKAQAYIINERIVNNRDKDPDRLYEIVQQEFQNFDNVNFDDDEYLSLKDGHKVMEEAKNENTTRLPLGIPDFDDAMLGGLPRGTLTVVLGGTNAGKSVFLINASTHFVREGNKVLHISLEGQKKQPLKRYMARTMNWPYSKILNYQLSDSEMDLFNKQVKELGDSIRFKHFADFNYTIEQLIAYCKEVKASFDFDAIVLDYGQILSTSAKFPDLRHRQSHVHRGLDSLASMLDVVVLTVAQANREGQEKSDTGGWVKMGDVSECFEIVRIAETVITISRSESDEASERVKFLLEKQREGRKGIKVTAKTNMASIGYYGTEEEGMGFIDYDNQDLPLNSECMKNGNQSTTNS